MKNNCYITAKLPKLMMPEQQIWEQLGFTFNQIPDDNIFCVAALPQGWVIRPTKDLLHYNIIDEAGLIRGKVLQIESENNTIANMILESRYKVCIKCIDSITSQIVYFGNEAEIIKVFGKLESELMPSPVYNLGDEAILNLLGCKGHKNSINKPSADIKESYSAKKERLIKEAIDYANTYYPEWEDVLAYWDINSNIHRKI